MSTCKVPGCDRPTYSLAEFCDTHTYIVRANARELEEELAQVLRLEAEFTEWCVAHGMPNPHD